MHTFHARAAFPALALLAGLAAPPAVGQTPRLRAVADTLRADTVVPDTLVRVQAPARVGALVTVGGLADDRARVNGLLGRAPYANRLLRSASSLTPRPAGRGGSFASEPLLPDVRIVRNSNHSFSLNDGAMWAGRGTSFRVTGGFQAAMGRVRLVVAPEVIRNANADADYIPYPSRARSRYAFPFRSHPVTDPYSIDLPTRFGGESYWRVGAGQTSLSADFGAFSAGATAEEQWWGPGMRNALLLSNNAGGVPSLYLRTERPLRTRIGDFEGRWMVGALTESEHFDTIPANDTRTLSAVAIVYTPAWDRGLSLGAARAVYRGADGVGDVPGRALDAWLLRVGSPSNTDPYDTRVLPEVDQVISLFGRWAVPSSGLEVYGEWARRDIPSLGSFLEAPHHGQGYTVGLQWARPVRDAGAALRVQGEATYVEQSSTVLQRYMAPWYLSRSVAQGYTQRGQVLGAAIGPGSSSQWVAGDWLASRWQAGVFAGRIRWQDDFHPYALQNRTFFSHDVSVFAGLRGSRHLAGGEIWAEYTGATRQNMFFQNVSSSLEDINGVDRRNHTLRFGWSPLAPSGR